MYRPYLLLALLLTASSALAAERDWDENPAHHPSHILLLGPDGQEHYCAHDHSKAGNRGHYDDVHGRIRFYHHIHHRYLDCEIAVDPSAFPPSQRNDWMPVRG